MWKFIVRATIVLLLMLISGLVTFYIVTNTPRGWAQAQFQTIISTVSVQATGFWVKAQPYILPVGIGIFFLFVVGLILGLGIRAALRRP